MRKIRAWKWENWPDFGHLLFHKSVSDVFKIALIILLMAGLSACKQIPVTGYFVVNEEMNAADGRLSTPQPELRESSLFSEEIQLSKTAFFEISPQVDKCHLAIAGNPLDASIPDGTVLNPGEVFVKIWRFKNGGACAWTPDYSVVWFSGDNIGIDEEVRFSKVILPDEVVEISVDMIAPEIAGDYQSNWKICDQDKNCFALGSRGEYPFWAKITVREIGTITPSPLPTMTATSVVFASGRAQLLSGENFDLDNGQQTEGDIADIVLGKTGSEMVLAAINEAEIAWFGQSVPTEAQCKNLLYVNDSISLQNMDASQVLCYKSSLGYPGYIKFNKIDFLNEKIRFEYVTWLIP